MVAKFLHSTATNYQLEELIKSARERLILISPFLQLNERIKELIEDKNRLKIDVRVVYGKNELQPEEINWLNELQFVRTSFCKNLHAKCYLNEEICIITSLNLYEFSQVNNYEMGVLLTRQDDPEAYREALEESQRIIRTSDEVRISLEKVAKEEVDQDSEDSGDGKLSSSKLARKHGMKTQELLEKLVEMGLLEVKNDRHQLTSKGSAAGGEFRPRSRFGPYFLWPENLEIERKES